MPKKLFIRKSFKRRKTLEIDKRRRSEKLKVLMISMDGGILNPGSESLERMRFYASVLGEVSIVILNSGGEARSFGNIAVYPTSASKIPSFFKAFAVVRRLLNSHSFDVISAQDPFVTGLIGYLAKKLTRAKAAFQIQVHTGLFTPYFSVESLKSRLYVILASFLLPRADCIKVVSEDIRNYIVKRLGISAENIYVLPVFIFFDKFLRGEARLDLKKKYPQFSFIALMASRLVGQKNIPMAIRAFRQLTEKYPGMGLIIVGSGPDEENLKSEVSKLNLEDNIKFESWSTDIASYYKTADLFLLTSDYEGWARTVLEAMASGLAVIMTDVGVAGEIVKNGENGVVVPIRDEQALANAVEELYNNAAKREKIRKAGYETIINSSFQDRENYLNLYLESFRACSKN